MDTIDTAANAGFTAVVLDPTVIGAILVLLGVVFTQLVLAWTKRKQYLVELENIKRERSRLQLDAQTRTGQQQLESLQSAVTVLQSEYDRLLGEVKELRVEMAVEMKSRRQTLERYSVSLGFVGSLLVMGGTLFERLDKQGIDHAPLPEIPELIREDLYQRWPGMFDFVNEKIVESDE